jgi:hypothetical protein
VTFSAKANPKATDRSDLSRLKNSSITEPVAAAAMSLLAFVPSLLLIKRWAPSPLSSDEWIYLGMAGFSHVPVPYQVPPYEYRYRVLSPLLVRLISPNQITGYYCLTLACLAIFVGLFWNLLTMLEFNRAERASGSALLVTLTYPVVAWLRYPFVPDPLTLVFSLLLIRAAIRNAWYEWIFWLSIGIVNEDKILFLVLPSLLLAAQSRRRDSILLIVGGTALSYLVLFLVHLALGDRSLPLADVLARDTLGVYTHPGRYPGMLRVWLSGFVLSGIAPFGLWILLGLVGGRRNEKLLLIGAIVGVGGIILFASDIGRELGLLAIFWIPFALVGSRRVGAPTAAFGFFCLTASIMQTVTPMFSTSLGHLADLMRVFALTLAVTPPGYFALKRSLITGSRAVSDERPGAHCR